MNIKFCGFLKENNQIEWTFYESSFPNSSFAVVYKEIFFLSSIWNMLGWMCNLHEYSRQEARATNVFWLIPLSSTPQEYSATKQLRQLFWANCARGTRLQIRLSFLFHAVENYYSSDSVIMY